ncbi:MAG TPA: glycosyl hydrolase 53 family protein [Polyangiaceae bacterium]|nr:glycosyl hydrolase 53 family protein [Polyangiaceae bacterium]
MLGRTGNFLLLISALGLGCSSEEQPSVVKQTVPAQPGAAGSAGTSAGAEPPGAPGAGGAAAASNSETNAMPTGLVGAAGAPAAASADAGTPSSDAGAQPFAGFILGADISSADEAIDGGALYIDTDGQQKSLLALLQSHGFNYIRLRTFVDPLAQYGYASGSGCQQKAEAYDDKAHTVAFAQQVKAAGMGLLLDFHYSDTWADPGKQVIPEAWRGLTSIDALAEQVRAYTVDVVAALVAAGARPDMVQVGNEITPGLLIHVPTANTDCYGNNSVVNQAVNGSQNNWDNLAALLRAGISGVRSVDPSIQVMLHIENTESVAGVSSWVRNAQQRGVAFDVLGLSAYEAFQGPSSAWRATLGQLAENFPALSFAIAEYNPQRRLLNDIMRELPDGRGRGTFFWEPTQSGTWGAALFSRQGDRFTANAADFAEFDQIRRDYGL